jgi:hypothetical protein
MDIRLARGRNDRVWLWIAILVALSLLALLAAMVFGDATETAGRSQVGANASFQRAPVLPTEIEPFEELENLEDRELGRLLRLTGVAESPVRANAVWVRTPGGRRILVRFEPDPPAGTLRGIYAGAGLRVNGYLMKVSRAEFDVWMDTLGVRIPRPKPGVKFGDLPDSNFAKIDSLFIKDYYISVRPEGVRAGSATVPAARPDSPAAAALGLTPDSAAASGTRSQAPTRPDEAADGPEEDEAPVTLPAPPDTSSGVP